MDVFNLCALGLKMYSMKNCDASQYDKYDENKEWRNKRISAVNQQNRTSLVA